MTWSNLIITPVAIVFYQEVGDRTDILEWIIDVIWTVEIIRRFFTADFNNKTFKDIATDYLKFWFWVDALSTFPPMIYLQNNRYINILKFLRILHFFELFSPFLLILEYAMKDAIRKEVENIFSLLKLFSSSVLAAHLSACLWVFIGKH